MTDNPVRIYGIVSQEERDRANRILPWGLQTKVMGRIYIRTLDVCSINRDVIGHILDDDFRLQIVIPDSVPEILQAIGEGHE